MDHKIIPDSIMKPSVFMSAKQRVEAGQKENREDIAIVADSYFSLSEKVSEGKRVVQELLALIDEKGLTYNIVTDGEGTSMAIMKESVRQANVWVNT